MSGGRASHFDVRRASGPASTTADRPAPATRAAGTLDGSNQSRLHSSAERPGHPLPGELRRHFEPRLGRDLGDVRLHTDAEAARMADALDARAFTRGRDIAFASGEYAPSRATGLALLGHELTHVVEQAQAGVALVQRQGKDTPATPPQQEDDSGKIIAEGLKTVAEQAVDNNPQVKSRIVEPLKQEAKHRWGALSTGEKGAVITWGVGTAGLAGGALLSQPSGRKLLSGVNLAAPLGLIPNMPLTDFTYTLPTGTTGPESLLRFKTGFSGDDLLDVIRKKHPGMPKTSLSFGLEWGYDEKSDSLRVLGGEAKLALFGGGLTLSGGTFERPPAFRDVALGPEGGFIERKKSLPEPAAGPKQPGWQVMLTVDLMKLKGGGAATKVPEMFLFPAFAPR